ncbi:MULTISPECIES: 2-phospho-L-lactate guanylyltransferase [unclassified Haladaptatus]|uniref:2-phospho-L-lactate guanylyltransferase n=1 Tax=unclassified Haladaptatus TaxID=2622732 RepID=UPI00209BDF5C|nr:MULTISPECIES: 2-phospho-L-lactate guanylyltransferase [unclassified Haladaptatus]MCO8243142.1 2-phospho-L-lactate guanylyltransferase [Haladaptatus sp. AB643]MCO8252854.1 2-phospho-L-lactate guanylyltransferase [Haladaptatus sp. AB618]
MQVVVPFAAGEPKTRLAGTLSADERREFALVMLEDVLGTIRATGRSPRVLTTREIDIDAPLTIDTRPLTPAVNAVLAESVESKERDSTAIVMADLALATPDALERLFSADGDVVLAPGRGGGTNALVARHPDFRVDYHGTSYLDHVEIAAAANASVTELDSHRLATDVDEPDDLAEVLLHGDGSAGDWLEDAGFSLSVTSGRVTVTR